MTVEGSIFHPDYQREPFWWEAARPGTAQSQDLPSRTGVLVVGSGYAGLAAALELKRGGADVTVVEALAFGEGASSRSGLRERRAKSVRVKRTSGWSRG